MLDCGSELPARDAKPAADPQNISTAPPGAMALTAATGRGRQAEASALHAC